MTVNLIGKGATEWKNSWQKRKLQMALTNMKLCSTHGKRNAVLNCLSCPPHTFKLGKILMFISALQWQGFGGNWQTGSCIMGVQNIQPLWITKLKVHLPSHPKFKKFFYKYTRTLQNEFA